MRWQWFWRLLRFGWVVSDLGTPSALSQRMSVLIEIAADPVRPTAARVTAKKGAAMGDMHFQ